MHARTLAAWIVTVMFILIVASYVGSIVAREIVGHSGFRLALAANAGDKFAQKKLLVAIGNSQLMDGISADQINKQRGDIKFVNLAFNGLYSADLVAVMETFYKTCSCSIERLFVNAGALEEEKPGTTEVQIFLAAFNKELLPKILDDDPSMRFSLKFLPLLHYNNEVFLRSAYYWLIGHDDQGHGNNYHFRIPKIAPSRLGGTQKKAQIDVPRLARLLALTRENNTDLVVVVPPFHPLYVENRIGFAAYVKQVRSELASYNVPVLDHSSGVVTRHDNFADLIHINLAGQKTYSDYFAGHVISGGAH